MEDNTSGVANGERAGCWDSFSSRVPQKKSPFCYWMLWEVGFISTPCLGCRKGFTPLDLGGGATGHSAVLDVLWSLKS